MKGITPFGSSGRGPAILRNCLLGAWVLMLAFKNKSIYITRNSSEITEIIAGFHPRGIFPDCKSVIVFGIALPKGLTKVEPRLIYGHFNYATCPEIDWVAFRTAKEIERICGGYAAPLPSDGPYEYWDAERLEGRGLISMKHAAVLAGLGTLGKSTLLLNEKYGNLLTLGVILTDFDLDSDPLAESICIEGCSQCIKNCPTQALDGQRANQTKCRPNTYGTNARGYDTVNCNKCRAVCPMRFGKKKQEGNKL